MAKVKVSCSYCGKEFELEQWYINYWWKKDGFTSYCSKECRYKAQGERQKGENNPNFKEGIIVKCAFCGKEFERKPCRIRQNAKTHSKHYCSEECRRNALSENQKGDKNHRYKGGETKIELTCEYCGKKFERGLGKVNYNKKKHGKSFCSKACLLKRLHENLEGHIPWNKGKKMSEETREKVREARRKQIFPKNNTEPERIFKKIYINLQLDDIIKDTSNNSFHIGRLNPDFIIPSLKIAIFVNGDYWHSPLLRYNIADRQRADYQINECKKHKWKAIIIWESDLKRNDAGAFVLALLKKEGVI